MTRHDPPGRCVTRRAAHISVILSSPVPVSHQPTFPSHTVTHPLTDSSTEQRGGHPSERASAEGSEFRRLGMEASGEKAAVVRRLMEAKEVSGKTFSGIAAETGLTNVYVAQLLRRQAQLKADTVPALRAALPTLTDDLIELMMQPPFRSYHPNIVHEPAIYRCAAPPSPLQTTTGGNLLSPNLNRNVTRQASVAKSCLFNWLHQALGV